MDIAQVKRKVGILSTDTSKDTLLSDILLDAQDEFKAYTERTEIPLAAEIVVVSLAAYNYTKIGFNGIQSQSYSGVSETYTDGYPPELKSQLDKFRKVKFL